MGEGPRARRGAAMRDLGVMDSADVTIRGGTVAEILSPGARGAMNLSGDDVDIIDARGRVLMPGFVDPHTHLCFTGSRVGEWERVLAGETYQQIGASGGGIMSTVHAVRKASEGELACELIGRADRAFWLGSTTIEVKSGYGLTLEHELKMLSAIARANEYSTVQLVPTALVGHAIDREFEGGREAFIDHVVDTLLPAIAKQHSGINVDAFCEHNAWGLAETSRLLVAAKALGLGVRVHTDQFTSMGMVQEAIRLGARSVDHLEVISDADARALADSPTIGVVLPCCGFHLDGRYADARHLADTGAAIAIATNCNPGSAPCLSMPMAIALGVRFCGLTPAEAIVGATANAAAVLGLEDRGRIAPGLRADLIMLNNTDERTLAYEFGGNPVEMVMVGGRIVSTD